MTLENRTSRIAKLIVDTDGISFDEAQSKLHDLTLEVIVGSDATSMAAHASLLTAVSVASRTFVGGVRVTGNVRQRVNTTLPLKAETIEQAARLVGATDFKGAASRKIIVGSVEPQAGWAISPWWRDWCAGTGKPGNVKSDVGDNPLVGIAAGAMSVGIAFESERDRTVDLDGQINLWPSCTGPKVPRFADVYLPNKLWLIGLGNLGQAFLWSLSALPFANPNDVSLVLQDQDTVKEENWATSILVNECKYGELKTKIAEDWARDRGISVRRIDRWFTDCDGVDHADPRLALSGVDKVAPRKSMEKVGFECIVDAGLGRFASDFDRYRVSVFDQERSIENHFTGQEVTNVESDTRDTDAYQILESEIGDCGAAEIRGASIAAPYVSAVVGAMVIARAIAVSSGCPVTSNEVGELSQVADRRISDSRVMKARGIGHAGNPSIRKVNAR